MIRARSRLKDSLDDDDEGEKMIRGRLVSDVLQ